MLYKRKLVSAIRDFPHGCGVLSGHRFSSVESSKQSNFMRPHGDLSDDSKVKKESSNHSETESFRVEGLGSSWDGAKEEPVVESEGCVQGHLEEEVVDEIEDEPKQGLSRVTKEKKRRLSVYNSSSKEVQRDVVNTSKKVIVLGLAATSTCPWRQPKKSRGSRQDKSRWFL